jgi:Protein kinase domain
MGSLCCRQRDAEARNLALNENSNATRRKKRSRKRRKGGPTMYAASRGQSSDSVSKRSQKNYSAGYRYDDVTFDEYSDDSENESENDDNDNDCEQDDGDSVLLRKAAERRHYRRRHRHKRKRSASGIAASPSASSITQSIDACSGWRRVERGWAEGHKTVNEYVLIKTIGRGTSGKVKLAMNVNDGAFYALKVLNKRLLERKRTVGLNNAWSDVMREIAIMGRLNHRNVVRLLEVMNDADGGMVYLVMELMEGGPLQGTELEDGAVGDDTLARRYFCDIVAGLRYLHSVGVLHRDLKVCRSENKRGGRKRVETNQPF